MRPTTLLPAPLSGWGLRGGGEDPPAAGHVEAGAVLGHEAAQVDVPVGLDAVAEQRADGGKGLLQLAEVVEQGRLAVDVERRAVFLGEGPDGHVFAVKDTI